MSQLTWVDLMIDDFTPDQFRDWLKPWSSVVTGRVGSMFVSKFGFQFLRRPEGHIEVLDVFTGQLSRAESAGSVSAARAAGRLQRRTAARRRARGPNSDVSWDVS